MLAYSSIAHAGYLLAALAVMTNDGMSAVMVYFSIYVMMNLGAFLVVILISNKIHSENINDYNGIGYRMPLYGVCMGVFSHIINRITTYGWIYRKAVYLHGSFKREDVCTCYRRCFEQCYLPVLLRSRIETHVLGKTRRSYGYPE